MGVTGEHADDEASDDDDDTAVGEGMMENRAQFCFWGSLAALAGESLLEQNPDDNGGGFHERHHSDEMPMEGFSLNFEECRGRDEGDRTD